MQLGLRRKNNRAGALPHQGQRPASIRGNSMAIYHCDMRVVSRSDGRSAVAAAAYRAGERLTDRRTGLTADYTRRRVVEHTEILLPDGAAADLADRCTLWNQAEACEARKDGRTAREVVISLPRELTDAQGLRLVRSFAQAELVERYGVAVDVGIHAPKARDGEENRHAHLLYTTRAVTDDGLGAKVRDLDRKDTLQALRVAWADYANAALAAAGSDARINHRSLIDQGITDRPSEGKARTPEQWTRLRELRQAKVERQTAEAEIREATATIHDLQAERAKRQPYPEETARKWIADARAQVAVLRSQAAAVQVPERNTSVPPPRDASAILEQRRAAAAERVALIRHNAAQMTALRQQPYGLAWLATPLRTWRRHQLRLDNEAFSQQALAEVEARQQALERWLNADEGRDWAKRRAGAERRAWIDANDPADRAESEIRQYEEQARQTARAAETAEAAVEALSDPRLDDAVKSVARQHLERLVVTRLDALPDHVRRDLRAVGEMPRQFDELQHVQPQQPRQQQGIWLAAPAPSPSAGGAGMGGSGRG